MSSQYFLYEQALDFPSFPEKPTCVLCLYYTPRSGSNLLADLMKQTNLLGFPLEYFAVPNFDKMKSRIPNLSHHHLEPLFQRRTSQNGMFSYKWNANFEKLDEKSKLIRRNPIAFSVFIDRQDKDAQAESFAKALKSGSWVRQKSPSTQAQEPHITKEEVKKAMNRIDTIRRNTEAILESMKGPVLKVTTEKLFSNAEQVITDILTHCNIEHENLEIPNTACYTASSRG